jgi:hypothetical protein
LPEWLVDEGIGETRAALVENGKIIEARVELEGAIPAGSIVEARLLKAGINCRNAIAVSENGSRYLLPRGAPGISEGARLNIEVTREAIPGLEEWKSPLGRISESVPRVLRGMADIRRPRPVSASRDELAECGWDDLVEQARTGSAAFAGGELRIAITPAMSLIDVDGYLPLEELVVRGASEAARAIRRLDIGGSIGIDLPTIASKNTRQAAADAIDRILPRPFERTAVNGFGFIQIVRPRRRPSLLELTYDRATFEARVLMRRLRFEKPGSKTLVAHPAMVQALEAHPAWLQRLSLQLGGIVRLRSDPSLTISGAYAEQN